jgi:hypothetical protein
VRLCPAAEAGVTVGVGGASVSTMYCTGVEVAVLVALSVAVTVSV